MDWYKAKKYIILLLAAVNVLLLFSILGHNNNASIDNPYFSKKALEDFEKILKDRDIQLKVPLPKEVYVAGSVNVAYESMSRQRFPRLFEDFSDIELTENGKKMQLVLPIKTAKNLFDSYYDLGMDQGREAFAMEFLSIYAPTPFSKKFNHEGTVGFNPLFQEVIYETSYINFAFDEEDVVIDGIFLVPREESSNKKTSISSVQGILNALPKLEPGDEIIGIDFIYYFDLVEDELYKMKDARAFPNWRIMTSNHKTIYIPAFGG